MMKYLQKLGKALMLPVACLREYPKVCVNLQTDVR